MLRHIGLLTAFAGLLLAGQKPQHAPMHAHREAPNDLEVSGLLDSGLPGQSQFVSREAIARMPQITMTMTRTADFPTLPQSGVSVRGVYLDTLVRSLALRTGGLAIEAICADGYTATYSSEYVKQHHPVFLLEVDGLNPHEWAIKAGQYDAGPYLIEYRRFVPSFRVLSDRDRPLEPTGIVKLHIDTQRHVFAGIQIRSAGRHERRAIQGYMIAKQNCFRCHNAGEHGGTKANVSWSRIGSIARKRPDYFADWVHDPQAVNPKAAMPSNLDYDAVTLSALQHYFAMFAKESE